MQSRIGSRRLAGIGPRRLTGALAITMATASVAVAQVALLPGCQNRAPEPAETKPGSNATPASPNAPASANAHATPEAHPDNASPPSGGAASPPARQAITWTVPGSWQTVPNPNGMRIASYAVGGGSGDGPIEVSVSRAGGSTAANIERWQGQFTDSKVARRAQETVHGLTVTLVEIDGTYSPGAMGAGDNTPHPHWALSGAIVETPAGSYFFKMLGPQAKVTNGTSAHDSFEALVNSIAPS
jgi:hypothetical protein